MRQGVFWVAIASLSFSVAAEGAEEAAAHAVLASEFIYEEAPYPECHASTIESTAKGLVAAWFGGTREGRADVGIWFARRGKSGWSVPKEVANGVQAVKEAG
ncbi:MAG: exo-alpha-sialidase, partial [Thermoguttaceae bacterium]|nr:exo-alpha-sialidase [Thermoguttaceae bacterium]